MLVQTCDLAVPAWLASSSFVMPVCGAEIGTKGRGQGRGHGSAHVRAEKT